jgi:hypothetical protein
MQKWLSAGVIEEDKHGDEYPRGLSLSSDMPKKIFSAFSVPEIPPRSDRLSQVPTAESDWNCTQIKPSRIEFG